MTMRNAVRLAAIVVACALGVTPAVAQHKMGHDAAAFDNSRALELSRAAMGRGVTNARFRDRQGQGVELDSFRGKPLVVSLIYTSCVHVCPMITARLAEAVAVGREALGDAGFSVVTIGFDTHVDTPDRMRYFADRHGTDDPGWKFLSGDAATVRQLSDDLGFVYFRSPNGFDHLAQTTIIDADGRVAHQVYGDTFQPPALVDPLKRLVLGTAIPEASLSGLIDRIRLFCTVYDPTTGRYEFDYSIVIATVIGLACLGVVAVFVARGWFDDRRRRA